MRQLLQQSHLIVQEGLQHLSEKSAGFVQEVAKNLLKNFDSPTELAKIIQADIQDNPNALQLFSEQVNSFYGCGDYHLEQCVLAVFLMFFPLYPQPYACYATLIWRKDGIQEARAFYDHIVDAMENPVLDYFAADCFLKAGDAARAKKLLQRALAATQSAQQEQQDLRQHITNLLGQCG